jgi:hypothetical protein
MGKTVVFAVAGSGKTTRLVEELGSGRRCLVFTYTEENVINLRQKISARYGGLPSGVKVMSYFTFLHAFCFRPIMGFAMQNKGLGFCDLPFRDRYKQTDDRYYLDGAGRLYHSRLSKLLINRGLIEEVLCRIDTFFDLVCVDEAQDFAGNDFNFLMALAKAKADMVLVGDFRQHTYDTSRDKAVNANLHEDFDAYAKRYRDAGITVDTQSLSHSRRCSDAVCGFISGQLGIPIQTHSDRVAEVREVRSLDEADALWRQPDVVLPRALQIWLLFAKLGGFKGGRPLRRGLRGSEPEDVRTSSARRTGDVAGPYAQQAIRGTVQVSWQCASDATKLC